MVRHRGASSESDRRHTCNQLTGTRPAFFSRYLNAHVLLLTQDKHYNFFKNTQKLWTYSARNSPQTLKVPNVSRILAPAKPLIQRFEADGMFELYAIGSQMVGSILVPRARTLKGKYLISCEYYLWMHRQYQCTVWLYPRDFIIFRWYSLHYFIHKHIVSMHVSGVSMLIVIWAICMYMLYLFSARNQINSAPCVHISVPYMVRCTFFRMYAPSVHSYSQKYHRYLLEECTGKVPKTGIMSDNIITCKTVFLKCFIRAFAHFCVQVLSVNQLHSARNQINGAPCVHISMVRCTFFRMYAPSVHS